MFCIPIQRKIHNNQYSISEDLTIRKGKNKKTLRKGEGEERFRCDACSVGVALYPRWILTRGCQ